MRLTTYQYANDFLDRVEPELLKHEAVNSLLLGLAINMRRVPGPVSGYLATIEDEQGLVLVALKTPSRNLILYGASTDTQAALPLLSQSLLQHGFSLPGVFAQEPLAGQFAEHWQKKTAEPYRLAVGQRIFELIEVHPPTLVPGRLRVATAADLELVGAWGAAFNREAHTGVNPEEGREAARIKALNGDMFLWELEDGTIVSLAAKTRPIIQTISIGPVYTPPEYRGKGYASNCVAALSQHLLDQGWKACCLFTDLSNPTSNSIYQKMGYRPLADMNEYRFE